MPFERTDVKHPLWRKKVDSSIFAYTVTTLPNWICKQWGIPAQFRRCRSRNDDKAQVLIRFNGQSYPGAVTIAAEGRSNPAFRLWFSEALLWELKKAFLMSYMRDLDAQLGKIPDAKTKVRSIAEQATPFWEFLDIEYFSKRKTFSFKAHYRQSPVFPNLFRELIGTPALERIEKSIFDEHKVRIYKQPWRDRASLQQIPEQENVIYHLLDRENRLFYVGEAAELKKRLKAGHPSIRNWTKFRFDVLPAEMDSHRKLLERMLIRAFASVMPSSKSVSMIPVSKFRLTNDRIDI